MSGYLPIIDRRIEPILAALADVEPVIALHGPRSVGKSMVLHRFAAGHGVEVIDLDDPATREAAAASPAVAVNGATPVCVDEYQHVPELLDAIKARLNREGSRPGTAVLTGSTRHDALPRTAQALTGRLHRFVIWPLSQGELSGVVEDLIPNLRRDPEATVSRHPRSTTARTEYIDRICAGGFPLALPRTPSDRNRWFDDYVTTAVERDAIELSRIRQRQVLLELFIRLAGQTAQVLNLADAARDLAVERKTIEGYTRLLEDLFLIVRLPAWGKTLTGRASARPKVHVVDSGLAARVLRLSPTKLASMDPTALTEFGHLLETFVVGELRKQVSWLPEPAAVGHWRTHDADEIDLVVEFDDGSVIAFEVKSGARTTAKDFNGLRKLRSAVGRLFVAGILLNTGPQSRTVEDRLHVMPVDRLWRQNDDPRAT